MMRLLFTLSVLLVVLVPASAGAKIRVVTTIQTLRSLAQEVGGDRVEVSALVGDHVDPHHVDPRPSYALVLNKADLVIHVGLELEKGWLPPLLEQARNPRIATGTAGNLDASTARIAVLDGGGSSRAQGDIHPLGNPHYWLSPDNALAIARAIADRLARLDPAGAMIYEQRYTDFASRLAARRTAWAGTTKGLAGVKVITYHRSWSYLTGAFGLVEIGTIEPKPGVPPDPKHLASLVALAKAQGARYVLVESFYPRNTAQKVAELAGLKLLVLPSDALSTQSYLDLMDTIVAKL
jgi:zinc/manganese transport system substrate-binding protein